MIVLRLNTKLVLFDVVFSMFMVGVLKKKKRRERKEKKKGEREEKEEKRKKEDRKKLQFFITTAFNSHTHSETVHVSQICRNDAKDHNCIERCHTEVHNCNAKGRHTKKKPLCQEKGMSPKRQLKMEVIIAPQRY
jgi:hypothetical protein